MTSIKVTTPLTATSTATDDRMSANNCDDVRTSNNHNLSARAKITDFDMAASPSISMEQSSVGKTVSQSSPVTISSDKVEMLKKFASNNNKKWVTGTGQKPGDPLCATGTERQQSEDFTGARERQQSEPASSIYTNRYYEPIGVTGTNRYSEPVGAFCTGRSLPHLRLARDADQPRRGSISSVHSAENSENGDKEGEDEESQDEFITRFRDRSSTCPESVMRRRKLKLNSLKIARRPPTPPLPGYRSFSSPTAAEMSRIKIREKLHLSDLDLGDVPEGAVAPDESDGLTAGAKMELAEVAVTVTSHKQELVNNGGGGQECMQNNGIQ